MNKIILNIIMLFCLSAILCTSSKIKNGWVDGDTFRASGIGIAKPGLKDISQRKNTACEAGTILAQKKIIEKFGTVKTEVHEGYVTKEYSGMVSGSKIISKKFDPDTDSCEVILEVKAENLRKMNR